MYIETKEIGPDGLVVDRNLAWKLPPSADGDDEVRVERVRLSGELHKEGSRIAFAGEIATVATLPCSRCLEAYGLPLDTRFDLLYTAEPEKDARGGESRINEDSFTEVHYDGARIDLDSLLAEQIYLALPLKPLCRSSPSLKGLCPMGKWPGSSNSSGRRVKMKIRRKKRGWPKSSSWILKASFTFCLKIMRRQ